jgi:hypothetical protein
MTETKAGRKGRVVSERRAEEAPDRVTTMQEVLEGMARGETVQDLATARGLAPGAVRKWFQADPEWAEAYRRARLLQGQAMAEEAVRIARDSTNYSSASDRLLIETLKWAASKANPSEFGDRQTVEHQGNQALTVKIVEDDLPVRHAIAADAVRAVEQGVLHALHLPPAIKS